MLLITIRHSKCQCEYTLTFELVPDCHKTPEMCKIIVSKDPFMLKYCAYISTTQKINENALDVYILTLKFVSEWFVTHKKLTNLNYCLLFNDFAPQYDYGYSDDNSVVDSDDYSDYIKILKYIPWFNKYNQRKENENKTDKEYKKR